ncbi:hypothetical protein BDZ91DRAFT_763887 [Kalaharituber pfeilii]|nr:hypothetical protein BDZ91DRAFT_763887 [Kalaharituber pfeilii]
MTVINDSSLHPQPQKPSLKYSKVSEVPKLPICPPTTYNKQLIPHGNLDIRTFRCIFAMQNTIDYIESMKILLMDRCTCCIFCNLPDVTSMPDAEDIASGNWRRRSA